MFTKRLVRSDRELLMLLDTLGNLRELPEDRVAQKFLNVCGGCNGAEIRRMGELSDRLAKQALAKAENIERNATILKNKRSRR